MASSASESPPGSALGPGGGTTSRRWMLVDALASADMCDAFECAEDFLRRKHVVSDGEPAMCVIEPAKFLSVFVKSVIGVDDARTVDAAYAKLRRSLMDLPPDAVRITGAIDGAAVHAPSPVRIVGQGAEALRAHGVDEVALVPLLTFLHPGFARVWLAAAAGTTLGPEAAVAVPPVEAAVIDVSTSKGVATMHFTSRAAIPGTGTVRVSAQYTVRSGAPQSWYATLSSVVASFGGRSTTSDTGDGGKPGASSSTTSNDATGPPSPAAAATTECEGIVVEVDITRA